MEENKENLSNLIKAIDANFGLGKTQGAIFFHHENGQVKTISPLFQEINSVQQMTARLLMYSKALKDMAEDLITKSLNKN